MPYKKYKKVSRLFWIHINPDTKLKDQKEWEQVKGRRVTFKGYEEFDFFLHKDRYGWWVISEGLTGMKMPSISEMSANEAIKLFKELILTKKGNLITLDESIIRTREVIKKGVEIGGISPRYKKIVRIV